MSEVMSAGRNSFYRGLSLDDNPWKGICAASWKAGWLKGKAEHDRKPPKEKEG